MNLQDGFLIYEARVPLVSQVDAVLGILHLKLIPYKRAGWNRKTYLN